MTRQTPEFDQRIADWLENDPDLAPSQVTATVLAALPSIRQRRRGWFLVGGRTFTMPNALRLPAAIAIVAIVGLAVFALLPRAPGFGGPGPTPTPSATPNPTLTTIDIGTITLTDSGCTWTGNPSSITVPLGPVIGEVAFVNQTDTFANFGIYRIQDGRTWAEAEAWVIAENQALHGGPSQPPIDFVTDVGSFDGPDRGQYPGRLTLNAGTHGVVCSSNEPPPGLIFAVHVVGPLEIAIQP